MAFEAGPPETGRAFPRGLVLGFTMAEVFILVIFVLLAAMLARERSKLDKARSALAQYEEVQEILGDTNAPQDPTVLRSYLVERVERFEAADNWRELVREIETTFPEPSAQDLVNRLQESAIGRMSPAEVEKLFEAHREVEQAAAHAELEQALQEAEVSPSAGELRDMAAAMRAADEQGMTPEEVRDAIENRADWNEAVDDAGRPAEPEELGPLLDAVRAATEQGLSPEQVANAVDLHQEIAQTLDGEGSESTEEAVREAVRDARLWREMGGEEASALRDGLERAVERLDRANNRIGRLEAQARARGGGGTDHPSCWYDRDGTIAYLFDVALAPDGFIVAMARAPEHREHRNVLPTETVRTSRLLTEGEFLNQTRSVYEWSVERKCRFFVRAFDLTATDQKDLYKRRMSVLESRFYKNANPTGGLPAGLRSVR